MFMIISIVNVIIKAGPASTCNKVIILHPRTSKHLGCLQKGQTESCWNPSTPAQSTVSSTPS